LYPSNHKKAPYRRRRQSSAITLSLSLVYLTQSNYVCSKVDGTNTRPTSEAIKSESVETTSVTNNEWLKSDEMTHNYREDTVSTYRNGTSLTKSVKLCFSKVAYKHFVTRNECWVP
jgi:hypothetical protein